MNNLLLNVPADTHLGHYDSKEVADGDKYDLVTEQTSTTSVDPDGAVMGAEVESGTFTVTKVQRMTTKQVYTTDVAALPKTVHKQLMAGRITWAHSGDGSDLKIPGTLVVGGRKLLHFVTDYSAVKVQQFIDANTLDWTVECHQPFRYSATETDEGSGKFVFIPAVSKGINASRVVPFIPKRYAKYDENGDGVGAALPPKKEWLHHFVGMSEWVLKGEIG